MHTPTAVRQAFAPEIPHELTLHAVLLLEAAGCRYLTGGVPGTRDAILCWLAITDFESLSKAHRLGKVDDLLHAWSAGRKPAEVIALQPVLTAVIKAAFAPAGDADGGGDDDDDPLSMLQKKAPAAAADGG